ncbi:hypothetical protein THAOC_19170 [Thalassiosira oceanica]|uniref:Uncharacterized protein n=1 Tax=Thalassiosira oceanica TaxID=159749 RepID=K0S6D8_THAOC|nr:hypothetical protein THAOC_19170 [Thalassiosira oceanica]|eukprot:EJK60474.1 hypothetical protein THAOC_19170 [Thalassiosira oceanica]
MGHQMRLLCPQLEPIPVVYRLRWRPHRSLAASPTASRPRRSPRRAPHSRKVRSRRARLLSPLSLPPPVFGLGDERPGTGLLSPKFAPLLVSDSTMRLESFGGEPPAGTESTLTFRGQAVLGKAALPAASRCVREADQDVQPAGTEDGSANKAGGAFDAASLSPRPVWRDAAASDERSAGDRAEQGTGGEDGVPPCAARPDEAKTSSLARRWTPCELAGDASYLAFSAPSYPPGPARQSNEETSAEEDGGGTKPCFPLAPVRREAREVGPVLEGPVVVAFRGRGGPSRTRAGLKLERGPRGDVTGAQIFHTPYYVQQRRGQIFFFSSCRS